ncbi:MAG: DUF202 domain-containing protein [Ornithinimicrobium sp.]
MALSAQHPHTAADLDAGLQPERTAMAWSRTALACCVVSAFTIRWLPVYGGGLLVLPALTLVSAVAISVTQQHRIRRAVAGIRDTTSPVNPVPVLCLVTLCWALGISSLVLVWVH